MLPGLGSMTAISADYAAPVTAIFWYGLSAVVNRSKPPMLSRIPFVACAL
jgi:hypothetical protein